MTTTRTFDGAPATLPKLLKAVMEIANVLAVGMTGGRIAALKQDECRRDN